MDIWGFNYNHDATGEGGLSRLFALSKRLETPEYYAAAFRSYQQLSPIEQQQVFDMCNNKVQDQIAIDSYKQGF